MRDARHGVEVEDATERPAITYGRRCIYAAAASYVAVPPAANLRISYTKTTDFHCVDLLSFSRRSKFVIYSRIPYGQDVRYLRLSEQSTIPGLICKAFLELLRSALASVVRRMSLFFEPLCGPRPKKVDENDPFSREWL